MFVEVMPLFVFGTRPARSSLVVTHLLHPETRRRTVEQAEQAEVVVFSGIGGELDGTWLALGEAWCRGEQGGESLAERVAAVGDRLGQAAVQPRRLDQLRQAEAAFRHPLGHGFYLRHDNHPRRCRALERGPVVRRRLGHRLRRRAGGGTRL